MHILVHLIVAVCVIFGVICLLSSIITEESDGSKLTARVLRAVAFLLLASLLNSFLG